MKYFHHEQVLSWSCRDVGALTGATAKCDLEPYPCHHLSPQPQNKNHFQPSPSPENEPVFLIPKLIYNHEILFILRQNFMPD